MLNTVMKWIGILDGVVMAGATALGQGYPAAQPICQTVVEVGGVIATAVGMFAHLGMKK